MSKSVFISRDPEENDSLQRELSRSGIEVICKSMIELSGISYPKPIPATDWIFFASKNAVRFFFAGQPEIGSAKLAAVGEGTAQLLKQFGPVSFTGRHVDTSLTAQDFKNLVGNAVVLFPCSSASLRTIQSAFSPDRTISLICYETLEKPAYCGHPDILVFSSPSNAKSYLRLNSILNYQKIIAFGPSTAKALKNLGFENTIVPQSLSDKDLFNTIIGIVES